MLMTLYTISTNTPSARNAWKATERRQEGDRKATGGRYHIGCVAGMQRAGGTTQWIVFTTLCVCRCTVLQATLHKAQLGGAGHKAKSHEQDSDAEARREGRLRRVRAAECGRAVRRSPC